MKRFIKLLIIPAILCLMLVNTLPVFAAASATVAFEGNSTVNVGDTVTVTMYVTNVNGTDGGVVSVGGNLSFDSSYLEYVSGTGVSSPYQFQINTSANYIIAGLDTTLENGITSKTKVFTFVFKALKPGETKVTLTNVKVSDVSSKITSSVNGKTITIVDKSSTGGETGGENGGSTGGETGGENGGETDDDDLSSDATLKSLSVSGYTLSPIFSGNVNNYTMKVQNSVTGLDVTAIANDPKAKVTISGNNGWREGVNVITIKVTAEDGTVNTYTVNVTRASSNTSKPTTTKSSDNYLEDLIINSPHTINKSFEPEISSYDVVVSNDVTSLDLSYITSSSKAKVEVIGNKNFVEGEVNIVEIKVTAEDGSIRYYTLNVTRSSEKSNAYLKDLMVNGYPLSPSFDKNKYDYTLTVGPDTDTLDITALPISEDSTVEIIGNKNLKEGTNTVLVKVTDKNGFSQYYTLTVEKEAAKEKEEAGTTLSNFQIWLIFIIIFIVLLLLLWLLWLLFKKKDKEEEEPKNVPNIEIKPEFNFGSKNYSDDDVIHGNYNQDSSVVNKDDEATKVIGGARETRLLNAEYEELPYDPYDEVVTKDELVDAIHEAVKSKDPSKLQMLLEQEALNRKKEELKKKEEGEKDND